MIDINNPLLELIDFIKKKICCSNCVSMTAVTPLLTCFVIDTKVPIYHLFFSAASKHRTVGKVTNEAMIGGCQNNQLPLHMTLVILLYEMKQLEA